MVSLMTALYFGVLEAPDRVSVKPHASPVLHAINHLLGRLDRALPDDAARVRRPAVLPEPHEGPRPGRLLAPAPSASAPPRRSGARSRTATSPGHFDVPRGGRQIALIGDAELDEGACWEAIADPMVARLGEVMWVVDLNRQSLDRVVPDIAAGRLAAMFEAAGWHTVMVKYGPLLRKRPDLRARIDAMPNEEYQRLLRADAPELRTRIEVAVDDLDDAELLATFRDLGGHDLAGLLDGYRQADEVRDRPSVIFAYTIKGWSLPTEGHPANHSALLNHAQYRELAAKLGEDADDPFKPLDPARPRRELCAATGQRLKRGATRAVPRAEGPARPRPQAHRQGLHPAGVRALLRRPRARGARRRRARRHRQRPTSAPPPTSAAGSTRPASGASATGSTGSPTTPTRSCAGASPTTAATSSSGSPRSTSSACSGELGATWSRDGQPLLPVGTIYDPFVSRALEPWSFGIYAGGQSILVGTPSGVTLGPEGGAHQSVITPSIGIEQPGCVAYEPAFGQDFEWCFLHALSQLGKPGGTSAYFRLSTRPIDQALHTGTREEALAGGYKLRPHDAPAGRDRGDGRARARGDRGRDTLTEDAGIDVEVVCITSADLLFRSFQARSGLGDGDPNTLERLFRKGVPIVSLLDGHPHTLAFLGSPITCLGVQRFGQAGDIAELYEHHQIDAESVVGAALDLLG